MLLCGTGEATACVHELFSGRFVMLLKLAGQLVQPKPIHSPAAVAVPVRP
jgi:hypothetical protein